MINLWMFTGEVTRVFSPEAKSDKQAMCRVTVKSEEYIGTYNGVPKTRTDYITCIAFGEKADNMGKLQKGDVVAVNGRPQAGRPWEKNKGKENAAWVADLECIVAGWELQASAEGDAGEASDYQDPGDDDADLNDPFANQH